MYDKIHYKLKKKKKEKKNTEALSLSPHAFNFKVSLLKIRKWLLF